MLADVCFCIEVAEAPACNLLLEINFCWKLWNFWKYAYRHRESQYEQAMVLGTLARILERVFGRLFSQERLCRKSERNQELVQYRTNRELSIWTVESTGQ